MLVKQRGFWPFLAFMLLNYTLEIEENCMGNTDEKPELCADSDNTQCYNHIHASYLSSTACTAHLCLYKYTFAQKHMLKIFLMTLFRLHAPALTKCS